MSSFLINPYVFVAAAAYDPDAADYISRVEAADGQALEASVKDLINDLFVGCKADGIFAALKASCIMAGARTLVGALTPLLSSMPAPTRSGTQSGWNYNRKTGLQGNGVDNYLDSLFSTSDVPQENTHLCVYTSTAGSNVAAYAGTPSVGNLNELTEIYRLATGIAFRNRNTPDSYLASGTQNSIGFMGTSRDNTADFDYRINGVTGTKLANTRNPVVANFLIFTRPANTPTNARLSYYSIGESLDLALLDARVSTFMSSLAALSL